MRVVIALGNPGSKYERTRHNVGWLVADRVAERVRGIFKPGKGEYYEAQIRWRGHDALLVKPTTYMNESGIAAVQIRTRYKIDPSEMLAVVDELQFPLGRIALRPGGSDGGHNGLGSMIYSLGTDAFPRLRCGIGNDFERGRMVDYVLSNFSTEESESLEKMIASAADAVLAWVADGMRAAAKINATPRPEVE
jgi:PTH1 family peptidyl-tRNA hydrolase